MVYPLAKQGVFLTVQGEGAMLGVPMVFVRLAGCSVGCPLCDTDYRVRERVGVEELVRRVRDLAGPLRWVWITGGEPTDHELMPLVVALRWWGFHLALATSGHRPVLSCWDWVSVSPHDPAQWQQKAGHELKIIPGLNGFRLSDFSDALTGTSFAYRYAIPCDGVPESLTDCLEWVQRRPEWRLGIQAHKQWNIA